MSSYKPMRLTLSGSGDAAYTQAIPMAGFNGCGASVAMLLLTGTTPQVNVTLQVSMDKENWTEPSVGSAGIQAVAVVGAVAHATMTPILAPYIRLKFTLTGDEGILNVNLSTYTS